MTLGKRHGLRFPVFVAGLAAAATALFALAWRGAPTLSWTRDVPVLLVLLGAVLLSELLTVMFPGSSASISMTYPLGVAIFVCFGASYGAVAGLVTAMPLLFGKPRMEWIKIAFNSAQLVLSLVVPGLLYQSGARLLMTGPIGAAELPSMVVPLALAATVGVAVNSILVPAGLTLMYRESFRKVWVEAVGWTLPSQVVLGFVGVMIAQIIAVVGLGGFALFAIPLIVARQTFQQSVLLRQAYADTISSMVAALEAKDVYTKGHSLRVAEYSVQIATALGVSPATVERIEYAALLHDLGKVGVSHRVLGKDTALSDAEYSEIKRHPDIGAHILSDVPYLADLVPLIAAHHERLDGSGYGHGLTGVSIPFEARILSVADAYDAMTSIRPYRDAMSHEAAVEQLLDGRGTQFDEDIVEAFLRALREKKAAAAPGLDGDVE
jgi:putative nucleotidyltransferase with HDIG domain